MSAPVRHPFEICASELAVPSSLGTPWRTPCRTVSGAGRGYSSSWHYVEDKTPIASYQLPVTNCQLPVAIHRVWDCGGHATLSFVSGTSLVESTLVETV